MPDPDIARRSVLGGLGGTALTALAGCVGGGSDEPGNKVQSLPTPVLGAADASVTMAVFEDFRCSHCKDFSEQIAPGIISDYVDSGQVRYEHRDFPVLGEASAQAANAARAVQDEASNEAFWAFSERLFAEQSAIGVELYESAADGVGATPDTVVSDAMAQTYQPVIDADSQLARDKGVRGTPTVMVEGALVDPANGFDASIRTALDAALEA